MGKQLLKAAGRLLAEHRMRKGLGQYNLARSAGMSKSKISKIETGVYNGLSMLDYAYLVDRLNLEMFIRIAHKGVMIQTRTGALEYHTELDTGASHCSGPGFTIVWQKGALCTQSDRNGATVEDIILVAHKRLEEFESGGFSCQEHRMAMDLLSKAQMVLGRLGERD